jgi:hypothetical protein
MMGMLKDKWLAIAIVFLGLSILISGYWIANAIEFLGYQL